VLRPERKFDGLLEALPALAASQIAGVLKDGCRRAVCQPDTLGVLTLGMHIIALPSGDHGAHPGGVCGILRRDVCRQRQGLGAASADNGWGGCIVFGKIARNGQAVAIKPARGLKRSHRFPGE